MSDDNDLHSGLKRTGLRDLGAVVEAGPLGNAYQRKNRGRLETLVTGAPFVRLLDTRGDVQLSAHTTLTIDLTRVQAAAPGQERVMPAVVGRVRWGSDGASHEALFDVLHGTTLSVAAASVQLDAAIESDPLELGSVHARASIGYMPRAAPPIRRTLRELEVPSLAIANFPIPAFATAFRVLRAPQDAVAVAQEDGTGGVLAFLSTSFDVHQVVLPDAVVIAVTNLSADQLDQISVSFELQL